MSRRMTKPTKLHVRPAKTQISLGIRPVWSESSLSAWRNIGPLTKTIRWAMILLFWNMCSLRLRIPLQDLYCKNVNLLMFCQLQTHQNLPFITQNHYFRNFLSHPIRSSNLSSTTASFQSELTGAVRRQHWLKPLKRKLCKCRCPSRWTGTLQFLLGGRELGHNYDKCLTALVAQAVECPLRGTGVHGFDPGSRHT